MSQKILLRCQNNFIYLHSEKKYLIHEGFSYEFKLD